MGGGVGEGKVSEGGDRVYRVNTARTSTTAANGRVRRFSVNTIMPRLPAFGIIAGATPLLTGTLAGHPSNRTMYSG